MRIRKDEWEIDTRTLIHFEWRNWLPRLVIHEKFENAIKWTLRILTFIGIATSVISLEWYFSLSLAISLLLIEQFFERIFFEYTTMVIQEFPKFNIDGERWITNGFAYPEIKADDAPPYVGPVFDNEQYARDFWEYIMSWNQNSNDDKDNNIILSFVIEPNEYYTTYIYANTERKSLDTIFDRMERKLRFIKFGKRQQKLVMQIFFAHRLSFKKGLKIHTFLDTYKPNEKFFFTPFLQHPDGKIKILNSLDIVKYEYRIKERKHITKYDPEYRT